jgi:hypothetical protein
VIALYAIGYVAAVLFALAIVSINPRGCDDD